MGRDNYNKWKLQQDVAGAVRAFIAAPAERRIDAFAGRVVDLWNARLARGAETLLIPTIGAAVRARRPYLTYQCPACLMIGDADIRSFERHPGASIQSLIPALRCPRCPDGPHARLIRLSDAATLATKRSGQR